jgi:CBS domain-containing protein
MLLPGLRGGIKRGRREMQVRDVLKTKGHRVITIEAEATVSEAIARMALNNIGSLPVVDDEGRLQGVFSERDVLRGIHTRGEGFGRTWVADVMTPNPVTCGCDDDVHDVMGKMTERRIAKVPVLDHGKIVGIISVGDVIKFLYERVQSENQYLMTYIHGTI